MIKNNITSSLLKFWFFLVFDFFFQNFGCLNNKKNSVWYKGLISKNQNLNKKRSNDVSKIFVKKIHFKK